VLTVLTLNSFFKCCKCRPLAKTRSNDAAKVQRLKESITEIGQLEPIDVLRVNGKYYGFSGCHRFEALQNLGSETIKCRVLDASLEVLHAHMR
jgi:sulfiredoxin